MRAIVAERFGPPEVLRLRELPRPRPGSNDLLVEVFVAGVNPVDAQNRADGTWAGIVPPFIPGSDASGIVKEVGESVRGFEVGDEVFYLADFLGTGGGAYAEYQIVNADIVAHKPSRLAHLEAAALPLAAGTAYELVISRLAVGEGDRLAVFGAAGGVGAFAVQLAVSQGARVIAVARAEHESFLRALGAERLIDYTEGDPFSEMGEVDVVIDLVGGDVIERALEVLAPCGAAATACRLSGSFELAIDKNLTLHGILVRPNGERLRELARLADDGVLQPAIRAELPLYHAIEAHRLIEEGHGRGKIVLRVRDDNPHS